MAEVHLPTERQLAPDLRSHAPLVERLRGNAFIPGVHYATQADAWMREAANELERLRAVAQQLIGDAWDCRGDLRRFEMDVRELVRNGGMTQATRAQLERAADRADASEKKAMQAIEAASAAVRLRS